MSNIGFEKPVVSTNDVIEIVKQYSGGQVQKAVYAGGVPNVTFIVTFDDEEPIALRIGNVGYTRDAHLRFEVDTLTYLETAGFKWSPQLIPLINSCCFIGKWGKFPVIAMKVIKGCTGNMVPASPQLCLEIGQAVGEMRRWLAKYNGALPQGEDFWSRSERLLDEFKTVFVQLSWDVDPSIVIQSFFNAKSYVQSSIYNDEVIHTDVWPPNIMVLDGHLSGILDFDDLAIGPGILDLVTAISEFGFDKDTDDLLAENVTSLVKGYNNVDKKVSCEMSRIFLSLIEASYCQWLACNAVHRVPFNESEMYYRRICKLQDIHQRNCIIGGLEQAIANAQI